MPFLGADTIDGEKTRAALRMRSGGRAATFLVSNQYSYLTALVFLVHEVGLMVKVSSVPKTTTAHGCWLMPLILINFRHGPLEVSGIDEDGNFQAVLETEGPYIAPFLWCSEQGLHVRCEGFGQGT